MATIRELLWSDPRKREVLRELLNWRDELASPPVPQVVWEELPFDTIEGKILPEGEHPFPAQLVGSGKCGASRLQDQDRIHLERLAFLASLRPLKWVKGTSRRFLGGSGRNECEYIVAVFAKVVVAECPGQDNAIYLLDKNSPWMEILVKPKKEALARGACRIVHRGDWQGRLRALVS